MVKFMHTATPCSFDSISGANIVYVCVYHSEPNRRYWGRICVKDTMMWVTLNELLRRRANKRYIPTPTGRNMLRECIYSH